MCKPIVQGVSVLGLLLGCCCSAAQAQGMNPYGTNPYLAQPGARTAAAGAGFVNTLAGRRGPESFRRRARQAGGLSGTRSHDADANAGGPREVDRADVAQPRRNHPAEGRKRRRRR